jgi:hypothetical protein
MEFPLSPLAVQTGADELQMSSQASQNSSVSQKQLIERVAGEYPAGEP